MTVFSFVLPLFVVWMVLAIIWARAIRFVPFPTRFLLGFFFFLITVSMGYLLSEFVINKGPDDWGSMWHAGYPLSEKYGKFQSASYTMNAFEKDSINSKSGTYHLHFEYNGYRGTIFCHYNKTTGKFDRDEIIPDK